MSNDKTKTVIAINTPLGLRAAKIVASYGDMRQALHGLLVDILKDCETVDKNGKMSENGSVFGYIVSADNVPKSYKNAIKQWVQAFSCFTFQGNIPKKDRAKVGQRTKDQLPLYDHAKGDANPFWTMDAEKEPKPFGLAELLKQLNSIKDQWETIVQGNSETKRLVRSSKPRIEQAIGTIDTLIAKLEGAETGEPTGNITKADQTKDRAKDQASKPLKDGGKAIHVGSDVKAANPLEVTMQ